MLILAVQCTSGDLIFRHVCKDYEKLMNSLIKEGPKLEKLWTKKNKI